MVKVNVFVCRLNSWMVLCLRVLCITEVDLRHLCQLVWQMSPIQGLKNYLRRWLHIIKQTTISKQYRKEKAMHQIKRAAAKMPLHSSKQVSEAAGASGTPCTDIKV